MAQRIKYETTTVDADRSASQIANLVRKYGGTRFEYRYSTHAEVEAIRFAIRAEPWGEVPVLLTAQTDRIYEILMDGRKDSYRSAVQQRMRKQSQRIAWRQLRDFVEQALLAVETGLFDLASAFMAHMEAEDPETGARVPFAQLVSRAANLVGRPDGDVLQLTDGR